MSVAKATLQIYEIIIYERLSDIFVGNHYHRLNFYINNLLLTPKKFDLTAYYREKISDYLLLNTKKIDLTADNLKKMRFFAASIKKQRHADWTQRRKTGTP